VSFYKSYAEKSLKNVIQGSSGAFGNAATRLEAFVVQGGTYAYGHEADIDALFAKQATQLERKDREATLHKMQQLVVERQMFTPIWQLGFLNGVGPRVAESGLGLITRYPYSAPYEDVAIKKK
jgi:peptide/nickel transport system substrate-binding protein